MGNGLKMITPL